MADLTWQDFEWEAELEGLSVNKGDLILNPDTDPFNISAAPKRQNRNFSFRTGG